MFLADILFKKPYDKVFIPPISFRNMSTTRTLLDNQKIKYTGTFDLGDAYKHLHDWLTARRFSLAESKYKEKLKEDLREFEIEWVATKEVDEYSKYEINTTFIIMVKDVKAEVDGETKTRQQGLIELYITVNLVLDREDNWESTPYIKFFKTFYEKYLYRGTIENMEGELWNIGWAYFNEAKAYLNLYRF